MKKINLRTMFKATLMSLSFILLSFAMPSETIVVGQKMPGMKVKLTTLDKQKVTIDAYKKDKGTLIIFSCNTCPFVIGGANFSGWEQEYNDIYSVAEKNNIGTVLINSNEAKRENGDNLEDMVSRASEKEYAMPYVLDKNHAFADAFGAKTTPHVFLFNAQNKLVYEGQINDGFNPQVKQKTEYLRTALSELGAGTKITTPKTDAVGCSIKRKK